VAAKTSGLLLLELQLLMLLMMLLLLRGKVPTPLLLTTLISQALMLAIANP
jgi:hypothetical protein